MKSKVLVPILFSFSLTLLLQANAGTISFKEKDGSVTTLANVDIVSIKDGTVIIEKDKKRRPYPLSSISSFSPSDTSSAGGERSIPGEFSNYKVTISEVKAPAKGADKDGKSTKFEFSYTVARTNPEISRIKIPYVYLYILVPPNSDSGEWEVLAYSYPNKAKPKGKGYDEAAILETVKKFDRPIRDETEHNRSIGNELKSFGDETVKFDLKGVKSRKLLAYHIEIWGNDSIVAEKDWKDFDAKVGAKWWQRY
ncbi:MAG: hypothetical protein WCS96_11070 [Victivallales bacterium]